MKKINIGGIGDVNGLLIYKSCLTEYLTTRKLRNFGHGFNFAYFCQS
jgi:hypothetical protein